MRSWFTLVLVVAALIAPAAAQPSPKQANPKPADPELVIGRELYRAGNYEAALGSFRAVIAARPDKFAAYVEAGRCELALGRAGAAIEVLVDAESRPGAPAEVYALLGQAYFADGLAQLRRPPESTGRAPTVSHKRANAMSQFVTAAVNCQQALKLRPDLHETLYYLGCARLQFGAAGAVEAAEALARAVVLQPDQAGYLDQLGEARYLEGKFGPAAAAFEKAAATAAPGKFAAFVRDAWAKAGECRGRAGDTAAALADFRRACTAGPDYAPTFQRIWNGFGGDASTQAEGAKILRALAAEMPDAALPPYYLGFFLRSTGDHKGARAAWEACLRTKRGATFPEAWALVGEYVWFDDKDAARAERCADHALAVAPRNGKAFQLIRVLTSARFAAGEWVQAENLTRKLLDCRPDDGVEWSNLALFLSKQKRYKEAWWAIEKALRLAPKDAQIHNTAGMLVHFHTFGGADATVRARELYQRALELDPNYLHAMENLGMVCAEQGDLERARELLRVVVDRDPGRGVAMRELSKVLQKLKAAEEAGENE